MSGQDRTQPREGRCNARLAEGRFCHGKPKAGTTRCMLHGGYSQKWSARQKALSTAAQDEIEGALTDPDLLDVRRPIALAEVVVARTPLIASDDEVEQEAKRRVLQRMSPGQIEALRTIEALDILEPTDADRAEVRLARHERSMRLVGMYALRQAEAVRSLEWSRVIRESVLPLMAEFGIGLSKILRKYLAEDIVAKCMVDVRKEMLRVVGELSLKKAQ